MGDDDQAKPRLVHVEDDAMAAGTLSRVLWPYFTVTRIDSFARALDVARTTLDTFDAAFIDVFLGDGDGFDLADRFRMRRPLLAIALTSGTDFRDEAGTRDLAFILKPWDATRLRDWAAGVCRRLPRECVRRGIEKLAREFPSLTPPELENLRLAAVHVATHGARAPLSRRDIAELRGKALDTVKSQIASAVSKTHARAWSDLVARVLELGVVTDEPVTATRPLVSCDATRDSNVKVG